MDALDSQLMIRRTFWELALEDAGDCDVVLRPRAFSDNCVSYLRCSCAGKCDTSDVTTIAGTSRDGSELGSEESDRLRDHLEEVESVPKPPGTFSAPGQWSNHAVATQVVGAWTR